MDFTLVQLRYFQEVARDENMTAAAQRINISQSTLSAAVLRLEQVFGTPLFNRHPNRSLTLTENGRNILLGVTTLLDQAVALREYGQGLDQRVSGTLDLGVFSPISPFRLPRVLQVLSHRHPEVAVNMQERDLAQLHELLFNREIECALMYSIGMPAGLSHVVVDRVHPHLLVHAGHPLASLQRPVHLSEVADEPFIRLSMPHTREYYDELFEMSGVEPRVAHEFRGYETVRAFVAEGLGYSLLNQVLPSMTYAGSQLVSIPLQPDLPSIDVVLAWPEGVSPSLRAQAFLDVCRRVYSQSRLGYKR